MSWKSILAERLLERDTREKDAFADLIETNNHLTSKCAYLSDHQQELEENLAESKRQLHVLQANSEDAKITVRLAERLAELEIASERWREERSDLYKTQGQNAQRLLHASDALRERDQQIKVKDDCIIELKNQLRATNKKKEDLLSLLREKDNAFQLLHDEYSTLQLELHSMEARCRELENDNRQLLERWLRRTNEEADKMNQANEFYEAILEQQTQQQQQRDQGQTSHDNLLDSRMRPGMARSKLPAGPSKVIKAHDSDVNHIAYSTDGSIFATASSDRKVKVFDTMGVPQLSLTGCLQTVMHVQFDNSSTLLLATSNDNSIRIWNNPSGRSKLTLTGHIGNVWAASFTTNASKVISGSHDRTIKVWDLQRGACARTIFTISSVNDLCLTDDQGIISGHMDNSVRFWDANTGDCIKEITGIHAGQITSVSVSPDAFQILTSSRDNTLKLVDIRTFQVLQTYTAEGYRPGVNFAKACFSSDGQFVATGSHDGTVFVWNARTGNIESRWKAHGNAVTSAAWSPLGRGGLLTADCSGQVAVWE